MADNDLLYEVQEIRKYLHRLDRRDRLRTIGGFIRGVIAIIPVIFVIYGAWYLYRHGDEVIQTIAQTAAEQASKVTSGQFDSMREQLQGGSTIDVNQLMQQLFNQSSSAPADGTAQ